MSLAERTGERSLLYSRWHRPEWTERFLGKMHASWLSQIDIDSCEYCDQCGKPLALIELQASTAPPKAAPVTCKVARLSGLSAFSVSYVPTLGGDDVEKGQDIGRFRWQQQAPERSSVVDLEPADYAAWLWTLREDHLPNCPRPALRRRSRGGGPSMQGRLF